MCFLENKGVPSILATHGILRYYATHNNGERYRELLNNPVSNYVVVFRIGLIVAFCFVAAFFVVIFYEQLTKKSNPEIPIENPIVFWIGFLIIILMPISLLALFLILPGSIIGGYLLRRRLVSSARRYLLKQKKV
jgi:ABC-type multidrug transport system permease subunit